MANRNQRFPAGLIKGAEWLVSIARLDNQVREALGVNTAAGRLFLPPNHTGEKKSFTYRRLCDQVREALGVNTAAERLFLPPNHTGKKKSFTYSRLYS